MGEQIVGMVEVTLVSRFAWCGGAHGQIQPRWHGGKAGYVAAVPLAYSRSSDPRPNRSLRPALIYLWVCRGARSEKCTILV